MILIFFGEDFLWFCLYIIKVREYKWQKLTIERIFAAFQCQISDDKVLRSDNGIDFIEFAKQRFIDRYKSGKIGVSSRENGISYMNQFAKFLKQEQ